MHAATGHATVDDGPEPLIPDDALHMEPPSRSHAVKVVLVGLVVWAVPIAVVAALFGADSIFVDQAFFFTGAALVTFGGAYAVLATSPSRRSRSTDGSRQAR